MTISIKPIFTPSAALSTIEAQFELRWAKLLAKARAAGEAVLETMKDIGLMSHMDPSENLSSDALLQQARLGVLFMADLLGLDYVADQLSKRPKVLLLTAVHALHDLSQWERSAGDNREEVVLSNYLVLAAKSAVTLQGLDIESDAGKEAYSAALKEVADELGVERIYTEVKWDDLAHNDKPTVFEPTAHTETTASDELPPPPAEVVIEETTTADTATEVVEEQETTTTDDSGVEQENVQGAEDDVQGSGDGEGEDTDADGEDKA